MARKQTIERPAVMIKPASYQPSKAELEEDVSVDATPEELAEAALRQVTIKVEVKKPVVPQFEIRRED